MLKAHEHCMKLKNLHKLKELTLKYFYSENNGYGFLQEINISVYTKLNKKALLGNVWVNNVKIIKGESLSDILETTRYIGHKNA